MGPNEGWLAERLRAHTEAAGVVGAAVGILAGGETQIACAGAADAASGEPLCPDTRFCIASVTKPMVASVLAGLASEGVLCLDDPLARWIPELAPTQWGARATLRHLLANLAGVPMSAAREWLFEAPGDDALARFAQDVARDEPIAEPGALWCYSNTGWSLLGRAIEVATGMVWEDAMRARLFEPLGMAATDFHHRPLPGPLAAQHLVSPEGISQPSPWFSRAIGPGGASVRSTVGDPPRFAGAHLEEPPGGPLAPLREHAATVAIPSFADAWCLGWARFDWEGGPIWGWDGIGRTHRALLRLDPARGLAVALLANTSTGRLLYRGLFPEILRRHGIVMPLLALDPRDGAAGDLTRFAGSYRWSDIGVEVHAERDHLVVRGAETRTAHPINERTFLVDASHPDEPTISFGHFGPDGRPRAYYRAVWALPRRE